MCRPNKFKNVFLGGGSEICIVLPKGQRRRKRDSRPGEKYFWGLPSSADEQKKKKFPSGTQMEHGAGEENTYSLKS